MTMRTQTIGVPHSGGFTPPRRALLAALGIMTALAVAGGIVAWRATDSGSGTAATGPAPATTAQSMDSPPAAPLYIYLVTTQAEGDALEQALMAQPLAEQPAFRVLAVAVDPAQGPHSLDALIEDVRASELELGRPLPAIVDLRS